MVAGNKQAGKITLAGINEPVFNNKLRDKMTQTLLMLDKVFMSCKALAASDHPSQPMSSPRLRTKITDIIQLYLIANRKRSGLIEIMALAMNSLKTHKINIHSARVEHYIITHQIILASFRFDICLSHALN